MAGLVVIAQTDEQLLAALNQETTILQITAPANQRLLVHEVSYSAKGVTPTDAPHRIRLIRQSSAGAGGSALTLVKDFSGDPESINSTALQFLTGSGATEPTLVAVRKTEEVHPQGGAFLWIATFSRPIPVKGGERLGLAVTQSGTIVKCVGRFEYQE